MQNQKRSKSRKYFVCQKLSAGSRHSLFLMINCKEESGKLGKKTKKVMISGLNQRGLCEEPGFMEPVDVEGWDPEEIPVDVIAGNGTSYVISKHGNLFSWGHNRFGVLGHKDEESIQIPRQVMSLLREKIKSLATGTLSFPFRNALKLIISIPIPIPIPVHLPFLIPNALLMLRP